MDQNITKIMKYIDNEKFALEIEKSILDFSKKSIESNPDTPDFLLESIYNTKLDEIIEGLKDNKNLIKDMKDASNIAFFEPERINPAKYEKLLETIKIQEYKKNDVKSSNVFTCSKCKKSRCEVSQKQVRAGDEPATTFVKCLECGHAFSFN